MKKSIFLCALVGMFLGCSNPAGGGDSSRTKVENKKGNYGAPYEVGDIVFNDGSATPYADIIAREETDAVTGKKITTTLINQRSTLHFIQQKITAQLQQVELSMTKTAGIYQQLQNYSRSGKNKT